MNHNSYDKTPAEKSAPVYSTRTLNASQAEILNADGHRIALVERPVSLAKIRAIIAKTQPGA